MNYAEEQLEHIRQREEQFVTVGELIDGVIEPKTLVWLDFETTGLDPNKHDILEIGCVVTGLDLKVKGSFHGVHNPYLSSVGMSPMEQVVQDMHEANGLLKEVIQRGVSWQELVEEFTEFVTGFQPPAILAGYGVSHMEVPWMNEYFAHLMESFTYYQYDVSIVRRMVKSVRPDKVLPKNESHRALMDVYAALQEWNWYSTLMKEGLF